MTIIQKIKDFLSDIEDISIGYNNLDFCSPDNLDNFQIGYSIDIYGNSLVTQETGGWEDSWIVIGNDGFGDPIFVDCSNLNLAVLTAQHGVGDWEPIFLADSLNNFKIIINELKMLSAERDTPIALENNPIKQSDKKMFIKKINDLNRNIEINYWEIFIDLDE